MHRLVFLVALLGCGKSKEECHREAQALGDLLSSVDTNGSMFQTEGMKLPSRPDLPDVKPPMAPTVILKGTDVSYQGQLVTTPEDLEERLRATHAKIQEDLDRGLYGRERVDVRDLHFLIDESTPWRIVAPMVSAAQRVGSTDVGFVFSVPMTAKAPPRAPIDEEIDGVVKRKDQIATGFADLTKTQIERCPAVMKLFGEVAETDEPKDKVIVRGLPKALEDCGCAVNLPNFRAVMWRLLVNQTPTRVLVFQSDAPKQTIALPAATPWKEASARFTAAVQNAELVVQ